MSHDLHLDKCLERTEAYHSIMAAAEAYSIISPMVPKALLEVNQHIHGIFIKTIFHIYNAGNLYDPVEKIKELDLGYNLLFSQYTNIEYLVKTKVLSVGAANTVLDRLQDACTQIKKWRKFEYKQITNSNSNDIE